MPAALVDVAGKQRVRAFRTALGWVALVRCGDVVTRLSLGHANEAEALRSVAESGGWKIERSSDELARRLIAFAAGERETFSDVALDLAHLAPFALRVTAACRRIPYGKILSYQELAAQAGSPAASRAVGNAMARNRFPVLVPCHRVIASGGKLGGYSARNGVSLKRRLLELEGVVLKDEG